MKMSRPTARTPDHLHGLLQALAHALESFPECPDLIVALVAERRFRGLTEAHLVRLPGDRAQRAQHHPVYRGIDDDQERDQHPDDDGRDAGEETLGACHRVREGHRYDLRADDLVRLPAEAVVMAVARDE